MVTLKGYYPVKIPVRILNSPAPEATFYVPVSLSPVPSHAIGQSYDQHTQRHTELGKDVVSGNGFKRRFKVADAETGALIPEAMICLVSTQTGKRECYDTGTGHTPSFSRTDIVALEVSAPQYDDFFGNLIITPQAASFAVDTIRLNRRRAVLSVRGKEIEELQLTANAKSTPLIRESAHYQHITTLPGIYSLQFVNTATTVDSVYLSEGINLMTLPQERQSSAPKTPNDSILVYFRQSDYVLSEDASVLLDSLAASLLIRPTQKVLVTGHTDSIGNPKLNQTLSEFRAKVVYNYLIYKKVKPDQIQWRGEGVRSPAKPNDVEENRRQNRRVVIRYVQKP